MCYSGVYFLKERGSGTGGRRWTDRGAFQVATEGEPAEARRRGIYPEDGPTAQRWSALVVLGAPSLLTSASNWTNV